MKLQKLAVLSISFLICISTLQAQSDFSTWASTPPMGWNSWGCYGDSVTEDQVKSNADYMAKHLKDFGWQYIVIDTRWYVESTKADEYNQIDTHYTLDEYGRYMPTTNRFPSAKNGLGFKPLADYIHSLGLKFGIHIMRGVPKEAVEKELPIKGGDGITADQIYTSAMQCEWLRDNYTILAHKAGAQDYYNSIMKLYASWGVDFIKVDDMTRPYHQIEIGMIRKAIDATGRPMILSLSPGETPIEKVEHVRAHANMWRMTSDMQDTWEDLTQLMKVAEEWYPYVQPGTWPDCNMIPLGNTLMNGKKNQMSHLQQHEQLSLMTFFCIFKSPLMFGGDLTSNDSFTLSLLTNKEVLDMHKESVDVKQLYQKNGKLAISSINSSTGDIYLALFNIDDKDDKEFSFSSDEFGLKKKYKMQNLWNDNKARKQKGNFSVILAPHHSVLYKIQKK